MCRRGKVGGRGRSDGWGEKGWRGKGGGGGVIVTQRSYYNAKVSTGERRRERESRWVFREREKSGCCGGDGDEEK